MFPEWCSKPSGGFEEGKDFHRYADITGQRLPSDRGTGLVLVMKTNDVEDAGLNLTPAEGCSCRATERTFVQPIMIRLIIEIRKEAHLFCGGKKKGSLVCL